jgi:hypothetical protein
MIGNGNSSLIFTFETREALGAVNREPREHSKKKKCKKCILAQMPRKTNGKK